MKATKHVVTILGLGLMLLAGCQKKEAQQVAQKSDPTLAAAKPEYVVLETSMGQIVVQLDYEKAPISSENFAQYVRDGFYDNTIFHRIVPGFVIQAGGIDVNLNPKAGREPIVNEAKNGLKNLRGTLSCARRPEINSATTHFFINLVDNAMLDYSGESDRAYGYAVFGKVVSGMDVVDKIAAVPTRPGSEVPQENVIIKSAKLQNEAPEGIAE